MNSWTHRLRRAALTGALLALPLSARAAERTISNFEADDALKWKNGEVSTDEPAEGKGCLHWGTSDGTAFVQAYPKDLALTESSTLVFELKSRKDNGQTVLLVLFADNPDTAGPDYYSFTMTCDWKGWKHVEVPLSSIKVNRSPKGLGAVNSIGFFVTRFGIERLAETDLCLDNLRVREP